MKTNFIRVTELMTGGDEKPLLLNINHIMHVQGGLGTKNTHIRMNDHKTNDSKTYYFVKETVDEIQKMMGI